MVTGSSLIELIVSMNESDQVSCPSVTSTSTSEVPNTLACGVSVRVQFGALPPIEIPVVGITSVSVVTTTSAAQSSMSSTSVIANGSSVSDVSSSMAVSAISLICGGSLTGVIESVTVAQVADRSVPSCAFRSNVVCVVVS